MMQKRQIDRKSMPELIADDLRERILSGDLQEGETIRQSALADEYDVSRMPIREALKILDAEGMVEVTNNKDTRVTKHSLTEIEEIFHLRSILETDLFRRSIPVMTDADIQKCDDILTRMERSYDLGDVEEWGRLNSDFHTALYTAAGKLSRDLLYRTNLLAERYVRIHLTIVPDLEEIKRQHRQLLAHAKSGDIDAACALLEQHIMRAKDDLISQIADRRHKSNTDVSTQGQE